MLQALTYIIMLVYEHLLTMPLHACMAKQLRMCIIANNAQKQQKLFVQGYYLKVQYVIGASLRQTTLTKSEQFP